MLVNAVHTLAPGIIGDFRDQWEIVNRQQAEETGLIMDLGKTSDKRKEIRSAFKAPGFPEFRPYGAPMNATDMDSYTWETVNYIYDQSMEWEIYDREDDQTDSLSQRAREIGGGFAIGPERATFDFLTGSASFLPNLKNAPDGLPLFSASTRFGHASGNVVSGQTLTTVNGIQAAIYAILARAAAYRHKGQPLLSPQVMHSEMLVIYSSEQNLAFASAFNLPVIETTSGNASQSNLLQATIGGRRFRLWESTRMTSGEMVCHLLGGPKPLYRQTRTPLREKVWNESNDGSARRYSKEGVGFELREGYGAALPFTTFKATA